MNSRTHVLVDLDGTISDSSTGIARSLHHAFTTCGYEPPPADAVRALIGPPFEMTLPGLGVPVADLERVVAAYGERYRDIGLYENELYAGITDMLTAMVEAGLSLALATAKPEPVARRITAHFGVDQHFVFEAGASSAMGTNRRTKGEVITYCLDELGVVAGDHVVMLGDRDHDVEGATENGIDCIGVTWGFGSAEELLGAGAWRLVDRPSDVVGLVTAKS